MSKISHLKGILSHMKVENTSKLFETLAPMGNSDLFNYATNKRYSSDDLKINQSTYWNQLSKRELDKSGIMLPVNGFEELIRLTEQGKLWRYPIDNEQGMEAEKQVPFEEHVFLDKFLKDFPQNESIQSFMELVLAGLAKNPWLTVERKHENIRFYKEYFEEKRNAYKEAGFDI